MLKIEPSDFVLVLLWAMTAGLISILVGGTIWVVRDIIDIYRRRKRDRS